MASKCRTDESTTVEVLNRVLDKGIVVDAWIRVSITGIDLVTRDARLIVASIETCGQPWKLGDGETRDTDGTFAVNIKAA